MREYGEQAALVSLFHEKFDREISLRLVAVRRSADQDHGGESLHPEIGGLNHARTPKIAAHDHNQVGVLERIRAHEVVARPIESRLPADERERDEGGRRDNQRSRHQPEYRAGPRRRNGHSQAPFYRATA